MIDHTNKFIFVHIGKTGGTSIEHTLNPNVNKSQSVKTQGNTEFKGKHWVASNYKRKYRDIFDLYFKFTFVRNPWELEVSLCKWFEMIGDNKFRPFKQHINRRQGNMGFTRFMCDKKGNNLLDFIGKFENLQEDFNYVCDKIGIPQQQLPHINKSKHKHYTEYYDDETKQIVAEKYAKDIEYFGYEFGE